MEEFQVKSIGRVFSNEEGMGVVLEKDYLLGMTNLQDFSYLNILWWFDQCDTPEARGKLVEESPYQGSPALLGTFATRAPERPNPIGLTCAYVTYMNLEDGIIGLAYIDAEDGTPVLDIKPYTPSFDRVEKPIMPGWCAHWPKSFEASGDFDWSSVFNF